MGLMRVHSHDPNPYIYSNDWMCMHALMTRQSSPCDKKLIKISLTSQSRILGLRGIYVPTYYTTGIA